MHFNLFNNTGTYKTTFHLIYLYPIWTGRYQTNHAEKRLFVPILSFIRHQKVPGLSKETTGRKTYGGGEKYEQKIYKMFTNFRIIVINNISNKYMGE
jgi:hypothetical protein